MIKLLLTLFILTTTIISEPLSFPALRKHDRLYEVTSETYRNQDLILSYPQIIGLGDRAKEQAINKTLKNEALKVESLYADADENFHLEMKYAIQAQTPKYLSVMYSGTSVVPDAAYPTNLLFTTNIDILTGERMKLSDIVDINASFIENFKKGKYKPYDPELQIEQEIKESMNEYSDENWVSFFEHADDLGEENAMNVFSYLTDDALGISFGVPHAIGDHAEVEIAYEELKGILHEPIDPRSGERKK
ncbi:polysaccharide deacetylase family protein [Cohnella cholangitidis]|uniref:DUF4163 domain-containing protein n=1 Tax=Cohnella cholangitidis TaxID=2598458 RepID=A0A7G5BU50_9BACL|nr:hypothetical protein [Cohnella cholangitidis]QMV40484.1 DUF4163 domain-containing protein [Cohnella cholangitidis]